MGAYCSYQLLLQCHILFDTPSNFLIVLIFELLSDDNDNDNDNDDDDDGDDNDDDKDDKDKDDKDDKDKDDKDDGHVSVVTF